MAIRHWIIAAGVAAVLAGAGPAGAQVSVIGNGLTGACSTAAKGVASNAPARASAVQECTLALQEVLTPHERAGTLVNRGVIYLAGSQFEAARKDFDEALKVEPGLPEALTNRGAAMLGLHREADAIADIDKGLALNPIEPEKAYFNRAVAELRTGDVKNAYLDFKKASELKPDWELPKTELTHFKVSGG